jgi:hypothetical protein
MNQRYRLLALLFFLAIGSLLLLGNPTGNAWAAPDDPDATDIVGGDPVPDPNPFVWQVSLQLIDNESATNPSGHFCGGSVIADRWILTAAHCVDNGIDVESTFVYAGIRKLSESELDIPFTINRIRVHPNYRSVLTGDDIALIEFEDPIPNAEQYIIPLMTVADESHFGSPGTPATVTGWGKIIPENDHSIPEYLQYAELPILTNQQCDAAMEVVEDVIGIEFDILPNMICAGALQTSSTNVCQGDSGGPLVVPTSGGQFKQTGIVSFGPPSCGPISVAGYTRVSSYIGWIEAETGIDFTTPRAPDLVIEDVYLNENQNLEIVIRNQGNARVALDQGFWVDLYLNPDEAPTAVNQTWNFLGKSGAVWGIDRTGLILLPGEIEVITLNDEYFWPTLSVLPEAVVNGRTYYYIPSEAVFYIQIDSANANTGYGAILERHELFGESYNNISGRYRVGDAPIITPATIANVALPERVYLPLIAGNANAATAAIATGEATATPQPTAPASQLPPRVSQLEAN